MGKIVAIILFVVGFALTQTLAQVPEATKPVQVEGVAQPSAREMKQGIERSPPVQVQQTGSQVYVLIITSLFTLLGTIFTGVMAYLMAKLNVQAKETMVVGLETKKTIDIVHTLVNSNMRIALEANAVLARRVADMTGKAVDKKAADMAEEKVTIHDEAQAYADAQEKAQLPGDRRGVKKP